MSFLVRLVCFATVLCGLAACGKDRCVGVNFPATNNTGVEASLTFIRLDSKWAVAQFHLSNSSDKPLELNNYGLSPYNLSSFTLAVAGGPTFAASTNNRTPFANLNQITSTIDPATHAAGTVSSVTNVSGSDTNLAHAGDSVNSISNANGTVDQISQTDQIVDQTHRDVQTVAPAGDDVDTTSDEVAALGQAPAVSPINQSQELTTSVLPPGGSLDIILKWRLLNKPAKNSDWTMKVTNLTQDGAPLADVVINRPVF